MATDFNIWFFTWMIFVNGKNWFLCWYFNDTAVLLQWVIFIVVFKCNYLFNCRLEFKIIALREIFVGGVEKLTGGWRRNSEGTTVPKRAILSVRYFAISAQKVSHVFDQCSCSVPLVLSNTVLFMCGIVCVWGGGLMCGCLDIFVFL